MKSRRSAPGFSAGAEKASNDSEMIFILKPCCFAGALRLLMRKWRRLEGLKSAGRSALLWMLGDVDAQKIAGEPRRREMFSG